MNPIILKAHSSSLNPVVRYVQINSKSYDTSKSQDFVLNIVTTTVLKYIYITISFDQNNNPK